MKKGIWTIVAVIIVGFLVLAIIPSLFIQEEPLLSAKDEGYIDILWGVIKIPKGHPRPILPSDEDPCKGVVCQECERCVTGSCRDLCTFNDCKKCIDNECVSSCGECKKCDGLGQCRGCRENACEQCIGGECKDLCDTANCKKCDESGFCFNKCNYFCETCDGQGNCKDICEGQCRYCSSDGCESCPLGEMDGECYECNARTGKCEYMCPDHYECILGRCEYIQG